MKSVSVHNVAEIYAFVVPATQAFFLFLFWISSTLNCYFCNHLVTCMRVFAHVPLYFYAFQYACCLTLAY
jgi:hypothetical protein